MDRALGSGSLPPEIPPQLQEKLRDLGGRFARNGLVLAGCLLAAGLAAVTLIAVLLDRLVRFDASGRWVAFACLAGSALGLVWLAVRLRRRWLLTDLDLARRADGLFPELKGDLLGTVELCRRDDADVDRVSAGMIRLHAMATERRTRPLDFGAVVPRRKLRRFRLAAAVPVAALLLCGLLFPREWSNSLARVLLPFLPVEFFTRTRIEVSPGNTFFARGTDLAIDVTCEGELPRRAVIDYAMTASPERPGRGAGWQRVKLDPVAAGRFVHRIPGPPENVWYRVSAGDARSELFLARAVERSRVIQVDLHYRYPRYTGLQSRDETGSVGDITALAGTEVIISARASGEPLGAHLSPPDAATAPMLQTFADWYEGSFIVETDGGYEILLEDEFGANREAVFRRKVRVIPDRPPDPRIVRPTPEATAQPHALVPVEVEITDDFAIERAWMGYRVIRNDGSVEDIVRPLAQEPVGARFHRKWTWDLSPLALQPGDQVAWRVGAADNRPPSGQEAESAESIIRIVSPFEELARLEAAEAALRDRLAALAQREQQLRDAWDALGRSIAKLTELSVAERDAVETVAAAQRRITSEARDVLEDLEGVRRPVMESPSLAGELGPRIGEISAALRRLVEEEMPRAGDRISAAGRLPANGAAKDPNARNQAAREALSAMDAAATGLRNLRQAVAELPRAHSAAGLLHAARDMEHRQKQIGDGIDDLLARQRTQSGASDTSENDAGRRSALAADQKNLVRDFEAFQQEFARARGSASLAPAGRAEQSPESPAVARAEQLARENAVRDEMQHTAQELQANRMSQALAREDQVESWLEALTSGLEELAAREAPPSPLAGAETMAGLRSDAERLQSLQQAARREIESPSESDQAGQIADLEARFAELARELDSMAREASARWPALSPAAAGRFGRAAEQMQRASQALTGNQAPQPRERIDGALADLDGAGEELTRAEDQLRHAAAFREAARALASLDRAEQRQQTLSARENEIRRSTESPPPPEGPAAGRVPQDRLRSLAQDAMNLADGLRRLAAQTAQAAGKPLEDCPACQGAIALARRMTEAAGSFHEGFPPENPESLEPEARSAFGQLRDLLTAVRSESGQAMWRGERGTAGGGPARGGYRFGPAEAPQGPAGMAAPVPSDDRWASLPLRKMAELEKGAAESFSPEFAALLRAYYRRLAEDATGTAPPREEEK